MLTRNAVSGTADCGSELSEVVYVHVEELQPPRLGVRGVLKSAMSRARDWHQIFSGKSQLRGLLPFLPANDTFALRPQGLEMYSVMLDFWGRNYVRHDSPRDASM